MLFENTWAGTLQRGVRSNANGELILNERIPRAVIQELIAEVRAASSEATEVGAETGSPA